MMRFALHALLKHDSRLTAKHSSHEDDTTQSLRVVRSFDLVLNASQSIGLIRKARGAGNTAVYDADGEIDPPWAA
jgi:hypothetical protein